MVHMYKQSSGQQTVLYLRVDLGGEQLTAGGSVAHTLGVIKGFISNGWSVVCASSAMVSVLQSAAKRTGLGIDRRSFYFYSLRMPVWLRPLRWKINCLLSNVFFTWRIIRLCSNHPITCVYQRHSPFSLVGVLVAWWLRVPLILEYNGSEVWMARHWDATGQAKVTMSFLLRYARTVFSLQWLLRIFEQQALQTATHIVVVSQASYQELVSTGVSSTKIIVKPNGVDAHEFDPGKLVDVRQRIRQQYGYQNKFVFGFVGTFSPWHGINQLAGMIPALVARQPNAAFLLVGDGQLKSWLYTSLLAAGLTSKQVIFTGSIAQHEAKQYLAACDAFLLPTQPNADGSQFFGSPIKLFEYMSMAKPIIASNIAQVCQILSGIALLVQPTDTQGFVDAADLLMKQTAAERNARGAAARAYVIAYCTWHEHVKAIITATRTVTDERIV